MATGSSMSACWRSTLSISQLSEVSKITSRRASSYYQMAFNLAITFFIYILAGAFALWFTGSQIFFTSCKLSLVRGWFTPRNLISRGGWGVVRLWKERSRYPSMQIIFIDARNRRRIASTPRNTFLLVSKIHFRSSSVCFFVSIALVSVCLVIMIMLAYWDCPRSCCHVILQTQESESSFVIIFIHPFIYLYILVI